MFLDLGDHIWFLPLCRDDVLMFWFVPILQLLDVISFICLMPGRCGTNPSGCWAWIASCNSWWYWGCKGHRELCCSKLALLWLLYVYIYAGGKSRKGLNGSMVSNCSCLIFITIFCNCIILYTFSLCKNKVGGEVMTYDRLEWIFWHVFVVILGLGEFFLGFYGLQL